MRTAIMLLLLASILTGCLPAKSPDGDFRPRLSLEDAVRQSVQAQYGKDAPWLIVTQATHQTGEYAAIYMAVQNGVRAYDLLVSQPVGWSTHRLEAGPQDVTILRYRAGSGQVWHFAVQVGEAIPGAAIAFDFPWGSQEAPLHDGRNLLPVVVPAEANGSVPVPYRVLSSDGTVLVQGTYPETY